MAGRAVRAEQVSTTRKLILTAAERLYAERGVYAVSTRQVGEAAGQGNNTADGYHFGTGTDLVRAIVCKHAAPVEEIRTRLVEGVTGSTELRDWLDCLVRPVSSTWPPSAAPPGTPASAPRS